MSRNSSGTYSLPSGNPVVTGTTISSTWGNTTLSDIGTELTNSLDRGGRGGMTAALPLANGTVSAPALAFVSEANSGLYRAFSHDLRISINGTDAFQVGVNGNIIACTTAATNTVPQDGLALPNGYVSLDGAVNPNSNIGFKNRLTPKNICKAWGIVLCGASAAIQDGFNITNLRFSSSAMLVDLVTATGSAPCAVASVEIDGIGSLLATNAAAFLSTGVTTVRVDVFKIPSGGGNPTQVDLSTAARSVNFAVYSAQ